LMIDIDCHKRGTLQGAIEFAEHLRSTLFPNLYFEVSTNGNGVHGYLIIEKSRLGAEMLNQLYDRLQFQLRQILKEQSFDVEGVELKGYCPVFKWGKAKRELLSYRSGQLAKLPRCLDRFEELKNTTRIEASSLFKLPIVPKDKKEQSGVSAQSGSCSGKCISESDLKQLTGDYLELAKALLPDSVLKTAGVGRDVVTIEDVAIFLMIGKFFTENMPSNGAMPTNRWSKMWTALMDDGDVSRPFNGKRFAAIRNYLTSLGLMDWQNENYTPGFMNTSGKWIKGVAAQWQFSIKLMGVLQNEEREASSMVTSTEERGEFIASLTKLPFDEVTKPVKYYPTVIVTVDLNDLVPIFDPVACLAA